MNIERENEIFLVTAVGIVCVLYVQHDCGTIIANARPGR
jgi:hypothetical protein